MRIIVPNNNPPDSFVDNVSYTLREMGHEVLTMPIISINWMNSPFRRIWIKANQKLNSKYIPPQEVWLLRQIKSFKPDIVLTLTQALSEETLFELKKNKIQTSVWWGDPPGNMKDQSLLCEGWDVIFVKDPHAVNKLSRVGLNAQLLHEAMNPAWHKPLSKRTNDNIIIAGSIYNYRHYFIRKLIQKNIGIEIYGQTPSIWADSSIKKIHSGKYVTKDEKSKVFGAGLACLNTTSMTEGNSINCRAFEIAGAGGLHIMENRPIISSCFEPGKEVIVFDTFEELVSVIDEIKMDYKAAEAIREAGYQRAINEHTYEKRLQHILNVLDQLK